MTSLVRVGLLIGEQRRHETQTLIHPSVPSSSLLARVRCKFYPLDIYPFMMTLERLSPEKTKLWGFAICFLLVFIEASF